MSGETPAGRAARQTQRERLAGLNERPEENGHQLSQDGFACNADMPPGGVRQFCELDDPRRALMRSAMNQLQLSARAYYCIIMLALTIAIIGNLSRVQFGCLISSNHSCRIAYNLCLFTHF